MVTDKKKDSAKTPLKQGPEKISPEPNKIGASTPYDFTGTWIMHTISVRSLARSADAGRV
jgi:hypothetical protein